MKLASRMVSVLPAAIAITFGSTLSAQQMQSGNWKTIAGAALAMARMPTPYASSCLVDVVSGAGVQAYVGLQSRSGLDLQARFTATHEVNNVECDLVERSEPDGLHQLRTFDEGMWGDGFRTIAMQLGFAPKLGLLHVAAGGGWEIDRAVPFIVAGGDVRIGSRLRWVAGAEYYAFRTPYNVIEEEWRNHAIVRSGQVADGIVWKRSWLFRAGAELPVFGSK